MPFPKIFVQKWVPYGVMVNVPNYEIIVCEFELQSLVILRTGAVVNQ